MWPYGYTKTNVPADMTTQDRAALGAASAGSMASTNGYKPEQASDLYISSGTSRDYQYGTYRIFAYTIEMSLTDYPDDSLIASETGRNKEAVLYLMERASCPLGVLGAAVRAARCGAFDDDLEVCRGWHTNPDGTDTAPAAARFAAPEPGVDVQQRPEAARDRAVGREGVRDRRAGRRIARARRPRRADDASARHAIVAAGAAGQRLTFRYVFAHSKSSTAGRQPAGDRRARRRRPGRGLPGSARAVDVDGAWRTASISLDAFAGQTVRLRFVAADGGAANLLEVELDDIRVTRPS